MSKPIPIGICISPDKVSALAPGYDHLELVQDKEYVIKKLGFTESEFDRIMAEPPKSHLDYPNSKWLIETGRKFREFFDLRI